MSVQCNRQAACVPECNKCDYAWNWNSAIATHSFLHPARSTSKEKSILVIMCNHLHPERNNMVTIHEETLSARRGATWQLKWWPLNKYCLKLMLSNGLEHVFRRAAKRTRRKSQSNYSVFLLGMLLQFDTLLLSLHLSFSLLFLNTFLFLPSHFSVHQRKLEMQEHIVTVGCFHLHSHLWHGQAWATSALRLKLGDAWLWTNFFF